MSMQKFQAILPAISIKHGRQCFTKIQGELKIWWEVGVVLNFKVNSWVSLGKLNGCEDNFNCLRFDHSDQGKFFF